MLKSLSSALSTFTGTLGVSNGGTGLNSLSSGYIPYGNGTSAFNSSSNLQFDGSNFIVSSTSSSAFRGLSIRYNGTEIASLLSEPSLGENRLSAGFSGFGGFQTIYTNGTEKARIFSSGGVSIGNTTDPGASNLSVSGSLTLGSGTPLTTYTEGTWTPVVTSSVGTITSYTATGTYTRTGRTVYVAYNILISNNGTGAGYIKCDGLPFTIGTFRAFGVGVESDAVGFGILSNGIASTTYAYLTKYDGTTYPGGTSYRLQGSFTYSV